MAVEQRGGRGAYYYRARWIDGHCVKEYVGAGELAGEVARLDAAKRKDRKAELDEWYAEMDDQKAQAAQVAGVADAIDRLVAATLLGAGYHKRDRGRWRRRTTG